MSSRPPEAAWQSSPLVPGDPRAPCWAALLRSWTTVPWPGFVTIPPACRLPAALSADGCSYLKGCQPVSQHAQLIRARDHGTMVTDNPEILLEVSPCSHFFLYILSVTPTGTYTLPQVRKQVAGSSDLPSSTPSASDRTGLWLLGPQLLRIMDCSPSRCPCERVCLASGCWSTSAQERGGGEAFAITHFLSCFFSPHPPPDWVP